MPVYNTHKCDTCDWTTNSFIEDATIKCKNPKCSGTMHLRR